jgi:deoxycytidylate deaminase
MCDPSSYDSCIIYVATDGYENCSKKFTNQNIKNLIEQAKKYSIEILYLGANQDAILEASKFGLDANQAMNYSENTENVESAYRSAARAAKRYRSGNNAGFLDAERTASVTR